MCEVGFGSPGGGGGCERRLHMMIDPEDVTLVNDDQGKPFRLGKGSTGEVRCCIYQLCSMP